MQTSRVIDYRCVLDDGVVDRFALVAQKHLFAVDDGYIQPDRFTTWRIAWPQFFVGRYFRVRELIEQGGRLRYFRWLDGFKRLNDVLDLPSPAQRRNKIPYGFRCSYRFIHDSLSPNLLRPPICGPALRDQRGAGPDNCGRY